MSEYLKKSPFVFWGLAIALGYAAYGFGSLINPFRWALSYIEVLEFIVFIPFNLGMIPRLFFVTPETTAIWTGGFAVVGNLIALASVTVGDPVHENRGWLFASFLTMLPVIPAIVHYRSLDNTRF